MFEHAPWTEQDALPPLEKLVLWTMRAWAKGIDYGLPVEEPITVVFQNLAAPGAASELYEVMWLVGHCAGRQICVDCVCNPSVTDDERLLLDMLALYQQDRAFEALILLRSLLGVNAALAAGESAERFATLLADAGHHLAHRSLDTARYVFAGERISGKPAAVASIH